MSTENIPIEDLIPHRDRMKLVGEILHIDDQTARTSSVVGGHWPLDGTGLLSPLILVELVAQTSGVHEGWKARREGKPGPSGWLVGIKKADFYTDAIGPETVLITTVRTLYALESYAVFTGTVETASNILAQVELQVFRSEEDG
jgi:predicted hotdog family 3-hydroxylacyl-ACP dehydratase